MTLVDEHGRALGRWNIVDVLIGVVLLLLIPMLYAGYALFRPAPASLTSIAPARVAATTASDITITGANLRPYMRVSFNEYQATGFLFADSTKAVVQAAADLPAGVYDVILYDHAQERARLPKALEVVANPRAETQLDVIGSFTGVSEAVASQLKEGMRLTGFGEILRLGPTGPSTTRTVLGPGVLVDVPSKDGVNMAAVVRADCYLVHRSSGVTCSALDNALMEDVVVRPLVGNTSVLFQIDQVRTTEPIETVTVRARMGGDRLVLDRMRVADRDVRRQNPFSASGTIVSLEATRGASASVAIAAPTAQGLLEPFVVSDLGVREVVLRLPAQRTGDGWRYAGRPLSPGSVLPFYGPGYQVVGTILSVTAPAGDAR
jgi:hypothetical protein